MTNARNGSVNLFSTKDSGQRQEFTTGSVRDTRDGKGRYDLLPLHGVRRLAQLYERGADKYGDRNWEKGQPLSRYADSMLRHAFQAAAGYDDEDHWAAVAWNALAVIDHQERIAIGELPAALSDLPLHPVPTDTTVRPVCTQMAGQVTLEQAIAEST